MVFKTEAANDCFIFNKQIPFLNLIYEKERIIFFLFAGTFGFSNDFIGWHNGLLFALY